MPVASLTSSSRPSSVSSSAGPGRPRLLPMSMHLADDLVGVLLAVADRIENLARRHGDFGGVDAVGAEHGAAAAFGTLVEIAVPLVQHFARQVARTDEFGKEFAGQGEVAAVHAAHQVLARHRHVLRVLRADEIVALVGAGAAMDAGIHVDLERTVLRQQFAHLGDGPVVPVVDQLPGKADGFVDLVAGDEGLQTLHRARLQRGNDRDDTVGRGGDFSHSSSPAPPPRARYGAFRGDCLPDCGRARKRRRVHEGAC